MTAHADQGPDAKASIEAIDRSHLVTRLEPQQLVQGVRQTLGLLSRSERFRALRLVLSMNVNALLGLIGLSSIMPFIHLIITPDPLSGADFMARTLRWLGFRSVDTALMGTGVLVLVLVLLKNLYTLLHTGWINRLGTDAELRLSTDLLRRIIAAPYDWLATQNGVVLREVALGRTSEWARSTVRTLLQIASDAIFLVFTIVLIVAVSPATGLLASLAAVAIAVMLIRFCRRFIIAHAEIKRVSGRLSLVAATEAIFGGRDVRMSQAGEILADAYQRHQRRFGAADVRNRQWQVVPHLGLEVVGAVMLIGVSLGAVWSGAARTDVATLLALYAVVAVRAIPIVGKLVTSVAVVASSLPTVAELRAFAAKLPPPLEPDAAASRHLGAWERLELRNVTYSYPGASARALGPVDLVVERGRRLGIVGASGAGKSTLVDVIVGLLRPSAGAMSIDGQPVDEATRIAWRIRIGYVSQTPFMLDGTMAENIEFGAARTPDYKARCRQAAEMAGLGELIANLPAGLATPLGDRGAKLSGGQRQRVAIARALYRNADLLVLDEASSALDSVTEREITEAIASLRGKLTIVVVAHRLSTTIDADTILVMDEGRVAAAGTHAQLCATSPIYRRLVEAQSLDSAQNTL
jgi:ABC-type multidrug transport system fused ATPase/permease subunit